MLVRRIIPCLLLQNEGLVKTIKFRSPTYIGDPINAVKIFNDKGADELIFLDIGVTKTGGKPNLSLIKDIAEECFMPFAYGGGVKDLETIKSLMRIGVEKIVLNTHANTNLNFLSQAIKEFASSSIVVAVDLKKTFMGKYKIYTNSGSNALNVNYIEHIKKLEDLGIGELFVNFIDRDGVMQGYDIDTLELINQHISVPVIACGGAGNLEHIKTLFNETKISAAAAGSIFIYHGKTKGILINYPDRETLDSLS